MLIQRRHVYQYRIHCVRANYYSLNRSVAMSGRCCCGPKLRGIELVNHGTLVITITIGAGLAMVGVTGAAEARSPHANLLVPLYNPANLANWPRACSASP